MFQRALFVLFVFCSFATLLASAQSGQWLTYGHDLQRSGFTPEERAFSPANVSQLGLIWKTVVPNQPLSMNGLTAPLVVRGVKTPGGNKNLVIVAGSSDHMFALDAETGELVWKTEVAGEDPRPGASTWLCPYSLNATPVIDPARSRVFVIASDGRLHTLALADGSVLIPPIQFVPAFSKMWSLNYSGGVLYTSLSQDCNNVRSGIVALDPEAPGKPVVRFYSAGQCEKSFCGAGIWGRGGPSIDFDGFIYGAAGDADFKPEANAFGDTILKLVPRTLQLAGYYTPSNWEYLTRRDLDMSTSTPVIFRWRDRVLTAVGGKEGAIYVADIATMSGPDHHAPAYISPRYTNKEQTFEKNGIWGEMSVWKDNTGQTWLYVPSWGLPTEAAQFPQSYGPVKAGSIMAFKIVAGAQAKPVLQPAWISRDISVPDPVSIAGGVAFVLGTGENTEQVRNGDISQLLEKRELRNQGHAILYALDARTGRELWSSGDTIAGWTHFSGLAVADDKILATTHDGAVYAFALRAPGAPAPRTTIVPGPPPPTSTVEAAPETPKAEPRPATVPECGDTNALFAKTCASCHGAEGRGVSAVHTPNFTDPAWQRAKGDAELLDAVKNGTDGGMPAFGDKLTAEQIDRLVHCMVRGFAKPQAR
ncbi:MAG TPA: c-type cytochrome [Terriglobales bacterium]|nr:c-type cytochrome [Terriglobales bacterium]